MYILNDEIFRVKRKSNYILENIETAMKLLGSFCINDVIFLMGDFYVLLND